MIFGILGKGERNAETRFTAGFRKPRASRETVASSKRNDEFRARPEFVEDRVRSAERPKHKILRQEAGRPGNRPA
jgi:hypothetical protein